MINSTCHTQKEIAGNTDADLAQGAEGNFAISAAQSNQLDNASSDESFVQTESQPMAVSKQFSMN